MSLSATSKPPSTLSVGVTFGLHALSQSIRNFRIEFPAPLYQGNLPLGFIHGSASCSCCWQLGWATGCWKMLDAGKPIYLPISCLTSYRAWSFLRVATFFAAWSFLALERKENMKVNIQIANGVQSYFRTAKGRKMCRAPLSFCRVWYSCWITQLANVNTAAWPCLFLLPMVSLHHIVSSRDKRNKEAQLICSLQVIRRFPFIQDNAILLSCRC